LVAGVGFLFSFVRSGGAGGGVVGVSATVVALSALGLLCLLGLGLMALGALSLKLGTIWRVEENPMAHTAVWCGAAALAAKAAALLAVGLCQLEVQGVLWFPLLDIVAMTTGVLGVEKAKTMGGVGQQHGRRGLVLGLLGMLLSTWGVFALVLFSVRIRSNLKVDGLVDGQVSRPSKPRVARLLALLVGSALFSALVIIVVPPAFDFALRSVQSEDFVLELRDVDASDVLQSQRIGFRFDFSELRYPADCVKRCLCLQHPGPTQGNTSTLTCRSCSGTQYSGCDGWVEFAELKAIRHVELGRALAEQAAEHRDSLQSPLANVQLELRVNRRGQPRARGLLMGGQPLRKALAEGELPGAVVPPPELVPEVAPEPETEPELSNPAPTPQQRPYAAMPNSNPWDSKIITSSFDVLDINWQTGLVAFKHVYEMGRWQPYDDAGSLLPMPPLPNCGYAGMQKLPHSGVVLGAWDTRNHSIARHFVIYKAPLSSEDCNNETAPQALADAKRWFAGKQLDITRKPQPYFWLAEDWRQVSFPTEREPAVVRFKSEFVDSDALDMDDTCGITGLSYLLGEHELFVGARSIHCAMAPSGQARPIKAWRRGSQVLFAEEYRWTTAAEGLLPEYVYSFTPIFDVQ